MSFVKIERKGYVYYICEEHLVETLKRLNENPLSHMILMKFSQTVFNTRTEEIVKNRYLIEEQLDGFYGIN